MAARTKSSARSEVNLLLRKKIMETQPQESKVLFLGPKEGYVVGSRAGAVVVGPGSRCWPAAFALCRCLSPDPHSVSSSRHIARSVRISRTTRSCAFRTKGYGAYRPGSAFSRSCWGRTTR
jgi:hypothetical protein